MNACLWFFKTEVVKMSIRKKFLTDYQKRKCRVTFILPKEIGDNAQKAHVVGEFNEWARSANPMKKMSNGTFVTVIVLPMYRDYQFRYLIDNKIWINDSDADRFEPTPFGDSENCVLSTYKDFHIEMIKVNQSKQREIIPNMQPLEKSQSSKSSARTFFSIFTEPLKTLTRPFAKSSLALKS